MDASVFLHQQQAAAPTAPTPAPNIMMSVPSGYMLPPYMPPGNAPTAPTPAPNIMMSVPSGYMLPPYMPPGNTLHSH